MEEKVTSYRLKVIPKAEPNSAGKWVGFESEDTLSTNRWTGIEAFCQHGVPDDHFLVKCEQMHGWFEELAKEAKANLSSTDFLEWWVMAIDPYFGDEDALRGWIAETVEGY